MSERDDEMMKLYSQRILALASAIPHQERLDSPDATVTKRSPLCGSTVTVDLDIADGKIVRFGQDVKACALGQASAAVFGEQAVGLSLEEARAGRDALRAMLREDGPVPDAPFDGYAALEPARAYRNRHASILLVPDATVAAFESIADKKIAATS
ncbi:iron-sulfur cluster assembly scaffold protein [Pontivivens nitratireducens]|uniref:Iron-sulfur cluster assembly scaffold protein n=1 Tax=Pontivivens nitratireducens TaxID=2758038 RepID=A0A6G7VMZ2_9RHOB|nr:iron-sulfur cluster assembly scaffold protein [Pontibrevibacter nitratireducens]QIK41391.1 iron-sulfur cluster assembly scaffold protein [Pontibrevibacter nitratireducens]